jgi:hypothetical protein
VWYEWICLDTFLHSELGASWEGGILSFMVCV